jgi:hypothetical protein
MAARNPGHGEKPEFDQVVDVRREHLLRLVQPSGQLSAGDRHTLRSQARDQHQKAKTHQAARRR